ncbi:Hypothetical protein PHPALM_20739 [Phytophthora palmivora]|uniref:Uncharacterized protein n=1 Tax=Phytophthora palmivora TaxID=4796 RepID=A0A2P4XE42_9STRA|nr:Hypothetical protein PHPALM_20739 [Phytophthora palmivora]
MVVPQPSFEVTRDPSLKSVCHILKQEVVDVTDDMLIFEMCKMVGRMVNDRVSDMTQLFAREFKMDHSEDDI